MRAFLTSRALLIRHVRLYIGIFAYGFSISMMLRGQLGTAPWDVLGQGASRVVGWSFGLTTILISIGVLLLWIPLKQRPGWGTVANTLLVGVFADVGLAILPKPDDLVWQILLFTGGLFLLALATALYIGAGMGPGPRDGLMTGLVRVTGKPVWLIRSGLELTVVVAGWALGGLAGIGTVVFALAIGPLIQLAVRILYAELEPQRTRKATEGRPSASDPSEPCGENPDEPCTP